MSEKSKTVEANSENQYQHVTEFRIVVVKRESEMELKKAYTSKESAIKAAKSYFLQLCENQFLAGTPDEIMEVNVWLWSGYPDDMNEEFRVYTIFKKWDGSYTAKKYEEKE